MLAKKKSYTERKAKNKPLGCSWSLICLFDETKIMHNFHRGKDCIERFCKNVKKLAIEIGHYWEQEIIPLTDKEIKFYKRQKVCQICKKEFCYDRNNRSNLELFEKVRDHCHFLGKFRGAAHITCNLRYKSPKKNHALFHNGSIYDYHFIIARRV